ncbi:hypothetical protein, partial [Catenulispora pinisilvae]|uniref:hypothetical protein n=1 Tax=Catenulispora pinisilvae TaxID=2705253 RepID=UPI001E422BD8
RRAAAVPNPLAVTEKRDDRTLRNYRNLLHRSPTQSQRRTGQTVAFRPLKTGRLEYGVILPLDPGEIGTAIAAAAHPAQRLAVALAAVHAAGPKAICDLQLDAVDLGNRRLTVAGHTRPIDDLTYGLLIEWLDYRRTQWPRTGNPHLLINRVTALGTGSGSRLWLTKSFVGTGVGLERLRVDRQLDEALTSGPDPLHLAEMFGIGDITAIRYAWAARQILESPAERTTDQQ